MIQDHELNFWNFRNMLRIYQVNGMRNFWIGLMDLWNHLVGTEIE